MSLKRFVEDGVRISDLNRFQRHERYCQYEKYLRRVRAFRRFDWKAWANEPYLPLHRSGVRKDRRTIRRLMSFGIAPFDGTRHDRIRYLDRMEGFFRRRRVPQSWWVQVSVEYLESDVLSWWRRVSPRPRVDEHIDWGAFSFALYLYTRAHQQ